MTEEKTLVIRAPIEVVSFEELAQQTARLSQFYKSLMQKGTDFDTIPGTDKPTLLKAGAELLRLWAGFTYDFTITDLGERPNYIAYRVICNLYRNGEKVGEGMGSGNSHEDKWRYRWLFSSQLPENINKATLTTKTINTKRGKAILYRVENDNPENLDNTILKIVKKRSFVDAVLTITGASRIFTQDLEEESPAASVTIEGTAQEIPNTGGAPEPNPSPSPVSPSIPSPATHQGAPPSKPSEGVFPATCPRCKVAVQRSPKTKLWGHVRENGTPCIGGMTDAEWQGDIKIAGYEHEGKFNEAFHKAAGMTMLTWIASGNSRQQALELVEKAKAEPPKEEPKEPEKAAGLW